MSDLSGVRVVAALNGIELFGHERGNIEVLKALRSLGAEVLVGVNALQQGGAVAHELRRLEFQTFPLPFGPQWSWQFIRKEPWVVFVNVMAVIRCSKRFLEALRRHRATHVHIGSPLVYSYLSLALALSPVPMIYRMGDVPPEDSRVHRLLWRATSRRARFVVANSDFVRRKAIAAGVAEGRIALVYNVAPGASSVAADVADSNGTSRAARTIVYVGALAEHKGPLFLVESLAALRRRYPDLSAELVGGSIWDEAYRAHLVARVRELGLEDAVLLAGHVSDPTPHYQRAAFHVAPSICEEAGPNVVPEAKRAGAPSVVFPSGGLPEMIHHRVDGYICSDRSVDALVEALDWMLADETRLESMREAARADYRARFALDRFRREWSEIYTAHA